MAGRFGLVVTVATRTFALTGVTMSGVTSFKIEFEHKEDLDKFSNNFCVQYSLQDYEVLMTEYPA